MGKTVKVTKVTVEYAFEGQAFRVDFPDPDKIDAIVFARTDFERLKSKQETETKKEVKPNFLAPGELLPEKAKSGAIVSAKSTKLGTTSNPSGTFARSLWWHSSACSWFHPEETDE